MQIFKIAAVIWAIAATPLLAQEGAGGIVVNGEGVISVAPDMATIRIGVSERAATASEALGQASVKVRAILEQLDAMEVAGLDRQTSGLYLRPVYENSDNRPRETGTAPMVVAYEAGNTVSVTVRDLTKLGLLLDAVVLKGANDFNGLQFDVHDKTPALVAARKAAVADAMAKGTQLAQAAGVKLGNLVSMTENSHGARPMEMHAAQMRSMDVPIESGELDVRAQVSMRFEIVPKAY